MCVAHQANRRLCASIPLQPGTRFGFQQECSHSGWRAASLGPFEVLQQLNPVLYKLSLPSSIRIHPMLHVSQLGPVHCLPTSRFYHHQDCWMGNCSIWSTGFHSTSWTLKDFKCLHPDRVSGASGVTYREGGTVTIAGVATITATPIVCAQRQEALGPAAGTKIRSRLGLLNQPFLLSLSLREILSYLSAIVHFESCLFYKVYFCLVSIRQ